MRSCASSSNDSPPRPRLTSVTRLRTLVDTDWLEAHLDDPELRVFDCTTALEPAPPESPHPYTVVSGYADYVEGHVPRAGFLAMQEELSDPDARLLFTAPEAQHFAKVMSGKGVGEGTSVVLYSAGTPAWATRAWWLLRLFGFDDAAVLDGGWERWVAEERPISTAPASYPPARFTARSRPELLAVKEDVIAAVNSGEPRLVNTLPEELFRGEEPSRYGRPGRIPTSLSLPYSEFTHDDGTFLSAAECETLVAERLGDAGEPVISYCGGGITATLLDFVLAGLDRGESQLYDGSLTEWAPDESLPLERG